MDYPVDVTVGPSVNNFTVLFTINSENLEAHRMLVTFHVVGN